MDERSLHRLNRILMQARSRVVSGDDWAVDELLLEAQRVIQASLGIEPNLTPRARLVSRGLHRSRKPRTQA